jgi:hypothetical protein
MIMSQTPFAASGQLLIWPCTACNTAVQAGHAAGGHGGPLPPSAPRAWGTVHQALHWAVLVMGFVRSMLTWRHPALAAHQESLYDALVSQMPAQPAEYVQRMVQHGLATGRNQACGNARAACAVCVSVATALLRDILRCTVALHFLKSARMPHLHPVSRLHATRWVCMCMPATALEPSTCTTPSPAALDPESAASCNTPILPASRAGQMFHGLLFPNLVGVVDNCGQAAPKAAHFAVQIMSLLACRRPAAMLGTLDPQPLSEALVKYLASVFDLVSNGVGQSSSSRPAPRLQRFAVPGMEWDCSPWLLLLDPRLDLCGSRGRACYLHIAVPRTPSAAALVTREQRPGPDLIARRQGVEVVLAAEVAQQALQ